MRRLLAGSLVAVVVLVLVAPPIPSRAAAATWRITRSPGSMDEGENTTVKVVISNLGGPSGGDDLGCVEIKIPSSFDVGAVDVTDEPAGTAWTASTSGNTTVTIHAANGGDRLDADSPNDSVTVAIEVTGDDAGHFDWVADAFESQDCDKPFDDPILLGITVKGKATPVPTAAPTPNPTAVPTPTPAPTATPRPTVEPTPASTPTPTAVGTPTPTPGSTTGATPTPTGSASPSPTDRPTSLPDPTASPSSTAAGAAGTTEAGGGVGGAPGTGEAPLGPPPVGPGADIAMAGAASAVGGDAPTAMLTRFDLGGNDLEWVVPGLILTFPGLLIVLVVILQAVGALAWVPIARRRLGTADPGDRARARRRPNRV